MDHHDDKSKPGNAVESAVPKGALQGKKAFIEKASAAIEEKLTQYIIEHDIREDFISSSGIGMIHDKFGMHIGFPLYAVGVPLMCLQEPIASMIEYAENRLGIPEHRVFERTWLTFVARTPRDAFKIYNEGFADKFRPDLRIDFDAIAKECNYDIDQILSK